MPNKTGFMSGVSEFIAGYNPNNNKLKRGFSLTEVLIALAIVAIIAVLVLPVVTTRAQNKSFATTYESQVKQMLNSLEGLPVHENKDDITQTMMYVESDTGKYAENAGVYINKYMKLKKYCGDAPNGLKDCFASNYYEYKNNDRVAFDMSVIKGACAQLKNGISICLKPQMKNTAGQEVVEGWIDLNGPKGPNVYGRDLREFSINLKQRLIYTDEAGNVIIPNPPEEGIVPDIPVPCIENSLSKECCDSRELSGKDDPCCKAGWYDTVAAGARYTICHLEPTKGCEEDHEISGPEDVCCAALAAEGKNDPKCCGKNDNSDYCCLVNPTTEACCVKKYVTNGEEITDVNNKCCGYSSVYSSASGCKSVCEKDKNSEECCKLSERRNEISSADDACCEFAGVNGTSGGKYANPYCCRLPEQGDTCCYWKSQHPDFFKTAEDGEACCHHTSFGIESKDNNILSKCCRADKMDENNDAENSACCEYLVGSDYSKLVGRGSPLRRCCIYDKYKNRPECCSEYADGQTFAGDYNSQCCMSDTNDPNEGCCFDSNIPWSGSRLSSCCSYGNKVLDSYTGTKGNNKEVWQKNCCSQGWRKYPSKDNFNSHCCSSTNWSDDCCDTVDHGDANWKKNCSDIGKCTPNTISSYDVSTGTYTGTKPTKECCTLFRANNWKAADGTAIDENYKIVCCKEYGICPDSCAIRAKSGNTSYYDLPRCCDDATMRSLHMKGNDHAWANGCCGTTESGETVAVISDQDYKDVCCNPKENNSSGSTYGDGWSGVCCTSYAAGQACCSSSKQGYRWDDETSELSCCDYSKNTVLGTPCCSSSKPGYRANNTTQQISCCSYFKDNIFGTPCCSSKNSGYQVNISGKESKNTNCCNPADPLPTADCCLAFKFRVGDKAWKAWDGTPLTSKYKDYCCKQHGVCDCSNPVNSSEWKAACCSNDNPGTTKDGNTALVCCDYNKKDADGKYTSLAGTACCGSQGYTANEQQSYACCNIGSGGGKSEYCCKYAESLGWPNTDYQAKCEDLCVQRYKNNSDSLDWIRYENGVATNCCDVYSDSLADPRVSRDCCTRFSDNKTREKAGVPRYDFEHECCDPENSYGTEYCCQYYENNSWEYDKGGSLANISSSYVQGCFTCSYKANKFLNDPNGYGDLYWNRPKNAYTDKAYEDCCEDPSITGNKWQTGCCSYENLYSAQGDRQSDSGDFANCCRLLYNNTDKNSDEFKATFNPGTDCCMALNGSNLPECQAANIDSCNPKNSGSALKEDSVYFSAGAAACCKNGPYDNDLPVNVDWHKYCCGVTTDSANSAFRYPTQNFAGCCDHRVKTESGVYYYSPQYANAPCPAGGVQNGCSTFKYVPAGFVCGPEDACQGWAFYSQEGEVPDFGNSDKERNACCKKYMGKKDSNGNEINFPAKNKCCAYYFVNKFSPDKLEDIKSCCISVDDFENIIYEPYLSDVDIKIENISAKCCFPGSAMMSNTRVCSSCDSWLNGVDDNSDNLQKYACCRKASFGDKPFEYSHFSNRCCGETNFESFKNAYRDAYNSDLDLSGSILQNACDSQCQSWFEGSLEEDVISGTDKLNCCSKHLNPDDPLFLKAKVNCCESYVDGTLTIDSYNLISACCDTLNPIRDAFAHFRSKCCISGTRYYSSHYNRGDLYCGYTPPSPHTGPTCADVCTSYEYYGGDENRANDRYSGYGLTVAMCDCKKSTVPDDILLDYGYIPSGDIFYGPDGTPLEPCDIDFDERDACDMAGMEYNYATCSCEDPFGVGIGGDECWFDCGGEKPKPDPTQSERDHCVSVVPAGACTTQCGDRVFAPASQASRYNNGPNYVDYSQWVSCAESCLNGSNPDYTPGKKVGDVCGNEKSSYGDGPNCQCAMDIYECGNAIKGSYGL